MMLNDIDSVLINSTFFYSFVLKHEWTRCKVSVFEKAFIIINKHLLEVQNFISISNKCRTSTSYRILLDHKEQRD